MRRARIDANHRAIVTALRAAGASVVSLASVGQGCPDIVAGVRGRTLLLEVKDGAKPPSARRRTPDQVRWHAAWAGAPVVVVTSVDEALEAIR